MAQAVYQQLLTSEVFNTQAEAIAWGKIQKEQYKAAGMVVKVDTKPNDATRRRWVTEVYLKS